MQAQLKAFNFIAFFSTLCAFYLVLNTSITLLLQNEKFKERGLIKCGIIIPILILEVLCFAGISTEISKTTAKLNSHPK